MEKPRDPIGEAVLEVARLMAVSAITAPKAKGVDNIVVRIIDSPGELERLASRMEELAGSYGEFFRRDAWSVRRSSAVVLIGCRIVDTGVKQPREYRHDVNLVLSLVNLGIAIGSAAKTASIHNVDNRIMYTIGVAAQSLGLMDADVVFGIPLSVSSKNIYFDRKWPPKTR